MQKQPNVCKEVYFPAVCLNGWSAATAYRVADGLQLSHYTRMLQACGRHPGPHRQWGAVLGTNRVATGADREWALTWHDLTEPLGFTHSRSRGKARRSLLERYDHEHHFRVLIADAALRAASDRGTLIVEPVGQAECRTCPYQQTCADQMAPQEPSTALSVGGLDVREWITLRRMGITTIDELAGLDTTDPEFFDTYHREVSHRGSDHARTRLDGAAQRAAMIRHGTAVLRTGANPVPAADLEIDCDIEWSAEGLVYLWGARVRIAGDESSAVFGSHRSVPAVTIKWRTSQWRAYLSSCKSSRGSECHHVDCCGGRSAGSTSGSTSCSWPTESGAPDLTAVAVGLN